jgi:rsbT co-antagonist protein RsbR
LDKESDIMQAVVATFDRELPAIIDELTDRAIANRIEPYASMPREQLRQIVSTALGGFLRDLASGTREQFAGYWQQIAGVRAEQGSRIDDLLHIFTLGETVITTHMRSACAGDADALAWWFENAHAILFSGVVALSEVFIHAHEQIIREQASRIRELSAPIIPVHSSVLVLPLVGAVDSYRAGQIMEDLLEGISNGQADVVIIDITGVPVVDTGVGNYLIQAARAARLLGSQVVLVGISAEIAQTIVQLGVDLSGITTHANLQAGIAYALGQLGLEIRPIARHPVPIDMS